MSRGSPRRLTRSADGRIAGVCGGIAGYFGWDPTAVRALYVFVSVISAAFPGLLVYVGLWLVMPAPDDDDVQREQFSRQ